MFRSVYQADKPAALLALMRGLMQEPVVVAEFSSDKDGSHVFSWAWVRICLYFMLLVSRVCKLSTE